jgi:hypothetical protein
MAEQSQKGEPKPVPKPVPPWRVRLSGADADLNDLSGCLKGTIRVGHDEIAYFLESDYLNTLPNPSAVSDAARQLLKIVSSVARVRRSVATAVKPTGVWWKSPDGNWVRNLFATDQIIVYDGTVRLADPSLFEASVKLAFRNETVRTNLSDFLGEWDFPRLRRVGETILLDLGGGDKKVGLRDLLGRGWANEQDCTRFWESVNYGDKRSPGAHSGYNRSSHQNVMNVIEAGEFLRGLLTKWLESKIAAENSPAGSPTHL